MPGAGGVELGFAEDASGAVTPEVLVRVQATSCASARIAALAPWAASVPGRTPEERVVRLSPRWPSARLAERLAERMALAMIDRRDDVEGAFGGIDRRIAGSRAAAAADSGRPPAAPGSAVDASILLLR